MVNMKRKRVILLAIIFFVAFIPIPRLLAQESKPPTIIEDLGGAIELEVGSIKYLPITVYDDKPTGIYHLQVYGNTVRIGEWGYAEPYLEGYKVEIRDYFEATEVGIFIVHYVVEDSDGEWVESNEIIIIVVEKKQSFQGFGVLRINEERFCGAATLSISEGIIQVEINSQIATWDIMRNHEFKTIEVYIGEGELGKILVFIINGRSFTYAVAFGTRILFFGKIITEDDDMTPPSILIQYEGGYSTLIPGLWCVNIEDLESGIDEVYISVDGDEIIYDFNGETVIQLEIDVPGTEGLHAIEVTAINNDKDYVGDQESATKSSQVTIVYIPPMFN